MITYFADINKNIKILFIILILINLQPRCFYGTFSLIFFMFISVFVFIFIYSNLCSVKYKSILYAFKTQCCSGIISFENAFNVFINTDHCLVIIKSCCLNPNSFLNSIAFGLLKPIIIGRARSSRTDITFKPTINVFNIFFIS